MAILLNKMWHGVVIDFGFVSSRILWTKFKFSRVEVCVVVKYGTSEGECKERRKEYWILDRNMDK